ATLARLLRRCPKQTHRERPLDPLRHAPARRVARSPRRAAATDAGPVTLLTPDQPRAPRAPVAALMDPPEGYALVTCPRCGGGSHTLQAAPVALCSAACADAAPHPPPPPPARPQLRRAER